MKKIAKDYGGAAAIPSPGEKVPQCAHWGGSGIRAERYNTHKGIDLLKLNPFTSLISRQSNKGISRIPLPS